MSDIIASARSMTTVADGQYVAIGVPKGGITPATLTAMVGMSQGNGLAIDLAANVKLAMTNLQTVASDPTNPSNVAAQNALNTLTVTQAKLFNKNNAGGFGTTVGTVQSHISDTADLLNATNFLSNSSYSDFGSGVTNMGSMSDRGIKNIFGSLPAAGTAIASTGKMFNGIAIDKIGTPGGIAQALQDNKLANATGLNQKLTDAGVNINDLHNPAYSAKISSVLGSIKDPAAINTTAEQFEINNPFAGLPSYTGSDSSLYNTQNALGGSSARPPVATTVPTTGTSAFGAPTTTGFPTAQGTSTTGTAFGSANAPTLAAGDVGGIQSLKDLGDYTKTANPGDVSGLSTDLSGIGAKFKDMGAGKMLNSQAAETFFSGIKTVDTPHTDSAHPTLNSLINSSSSSIQSLIGSSSIPTVRDFLGPVGGCPEIDDLANGVTASRLTALENRLSSTNTLLQASGLTTNTAPATQSLSGVMGFATKLHTYGKDQSTGGMAEMLRNMANSSTKYGEAVKASLAEGSNNNLYGANGMGPFTTNPFEGVPSYTGTDGSIETGAAARMMGGGG